MRDSSVIVAGARTPVGRLMGSLKNFSGSDLGGIAIKAALDKAGISGDEVQYVIMGQVLTAGVGQIPARQAAVSAGIPMTVPALTVNKVCLSGIDAIALADQLIRAGEFDVIVAGGQESMSQAPHLLPRSREGFKYGEVLMTDHLAYDGLYDIFTDQAMGVLTETRNATDRGPSRARSRTTSLPIRTNVQQRRGRTGCSTTRLFPSPCHRGRANRSSSAGTRAFGPTPRPSRWRPSGQRSARPVRSRPARHPNYRTVQPQSSS